MRFIEVCAGAGGMSKGLMKAGWQPIMLLDNDKDCCETLRLNHPNVKILHKSMTDVKLDEYKDKVDVLVGGIPCQSFSQAGERKGLEDARGQLVIHFARMCLEGDVSYFIVENVKGLLTHDKGKTFETFKKHLENNGTYHISYKVLNSNDYGVAQKRERLFIIGSKDKIDFPFPSAIEPKPVLKDILKDVPDSPHTPYSENKRKVLELVPAGGCWVDLPKDIQKEYLGKSYTSGGGKRGIARRLSMDEPCLTLVTSPSQKQTERCHPTETRPFTLRESARIQSFPDDYKFHGSTSSVYKQIGNAVAVEVAYHVAKAFKEINHN
jgi:DNA (cytosine-5)-methyltransferase 1